MPEELAYASGFYVSLQTTSFPGIFHSQELAFMHPVAFHIGSFAIKWYGVMVALGFIAGLWTAGRRSLRAGIASEKVMDLGPWLIAGALIGARILYVISYWQEFADRPLWQIFNIREGGLVYYGGFIGSSLAYIIYTRIKKLPLWGLADVLAPSIALGQAFGRVGCFLNGCCYGRVCAMPWGVRFPADPGDPLRPTTAVHPTQIYESLLCLALYAGLAQLFRRKKFDGQIFSAYLVGYAALRSFVELFRGDYLASQHYLGGWATPAHWVSFFLFATGLVLLFVLPRLTKNVKASERQNVRSVERGA